MWWDEMEQVGEGRAGGAGGACPAQCVIRAAVVGLGGEVWRWWQRIELGSRTRTMPNVIDASTMVTTLGVQIMRMMTSQT